jgi:hypothetical protein
MRMVICLQITATFFIGGKTTSLLLNAHRFSDFRQTEIHRSTTVPDPGHFEVEIAIAKLKRYKTRSSDQIPAGGEILCSEIHKLTTDQIFCIRQILEKKWEYNETVHQLFVHLKKASNSVRSEILHNILIEFGVPIKLVRLIKMWHSSDIWERL